jgi:hypothetical protein
MYLFLCCYEHLVEKPLVRCSRTESVSSLLVSLYLDMLLTYVL